MYTCTKCQTSQSWQPLNEGVCDDCWHKDRLEYLRTQINNECISMGEITELESLAEHIDPDDAQLLEWAGVPEFKENATKPTTLPCPLCGSDLHYKSNQQYWSCEDCPAILLEYVNRGDAHKVADHLDAK